MTPRPQRPRAEGLSLVQEFKEFVIEGCQAGATYRLAATRHAPQGTAGAALGRSAGESLEFMDHREYQPGDDIRRLDWAAYARTDRPIVKLYRQELCPHLDIVLDGSRSMAVEGTDMARAALGLAAALATAATNAGFSRTIFLAGDVCQPVEGSPGHPQQWQGIQFEAGSSVSQSLADSGPAFRPNGLRVLISDLLWPGEPMETLAYLAQRAAGVFVLQVLAAVDLDPPRPGNIRLVDSETGQEKEVYLDEPARKLYRGALEDHLNLWRGAALQTGTTQITLEAEKLVNGWDLSPLVEAQLLRSDLRST